MLEFERAGLIRTLGPTSRYGQEGFGMLCHCCFVVVVVNVGDNGNDNEIYALVTIAKWYAHSFKHLCIDKMPLVLKHMLVNCNSNMCSEL